MDGSRDANPDLTTLGTKATNISDSSTKYSSQKDHASQSDKPKGKEQTPSPSIPLSRVWISPLKGLKLPNSPYLIRWLF